MIEYYKNFRKWKTSERPNWGGWEDNSVSKMLSTQE